MVDIEFYVPIEQFPCKRRISRNRTKRDLRAAQQTAAMMQFIKEYEKIGVKVQYGKIAKLLKKLPRKRYKGLV